jgi:hypothetical protein
MKKILVITLIVGGVLALGTCGSVTSSSDAKCILDDSSIDQCNL